MSDPRHAKRGSAGDKGGHNPVNTRPPQEYLCVVGSCSNAFNGYMEPDSAAPDGWKARPHPFNVYGVTRYIAAPGVTHDLYWANFLDPAVKLFSTGIAKPLPGDVVTLLIFGQGYLKRNKVDWDASPNNPIHHRSPWMKKKTPSTTDYSPANIDRSKPDREDVVDHDILMRTTDGNSDGVIKHPVSGSHYQEYLHHIARKIVYGPQLAGPPLLKDVLVKLLIFNDREHLTQYIREGKFSGGKYWKHVLDTVDEEDMASAVALNEDGSFYDASIGFSSPRWQTLWNRRFKNGLQPPHVDRKKVKIRRFDYIGHSDAEQFYLLYGWTNKKGELPNKDVTVFTIDDLKAAFAPGTLTADAFAQLWGCNQGGATAAALAGAFKETVACEASTYYDHILDSPDSMPIPEEGSEWKTFKRGK